MAEEKQEKKISQKVEKLLTEIEKLSVLELADLVSSLEEKFGVSATAVPAAAPAGAPAQASQETSGEEKTSFTVVLKTDGGKKIPVLKAVRELRQDLSLVDAKKFVESLPKEVLTGVKKEEAEQAKKKLEEAGGTVELT